MIRFRNAALAALAVLPLFAVVNSAAADSDWDDIPCAVPAGSAQLDSAKAIAIGESLGYRIAGYELDDGCIELTGADANGARIELRLDPVSGAVIPYRR